MYLKEYINKLKNGDFIDEKKWLDQNAILETIIEEIPDSGTEEWKNFKTNSIKETSWNSPAQIQIYMAKSLIPAAGILLMIQGISEVCRAIICIQTGHWPARMVVAEETEKMLMRTSQDEDQKDVI